MSLTLSHCVPSDAQEYASVFLDTYKHSPRHELTFGAIPRERQLEMGTKDFRAGIESQDHPTPSQETHYLKVTDSATNEMVAFAIWLYLPQGYKFEEDSFANPEKVPEGANEKLMRHIGKEVGRMRGEHEGRRREHWVLALLGTHPKHERRGAGAMLTRWPFAQADRDGKRCYVDASSIGYPMYRRWGFKDVGEMSVDLDEYGGQGLGVQRWVAMLREPERRESDEKSSPNE